MGIVTTAHKSTARARLAQAAALTVAVAAILAAAPSRACYSGLAVIPTADLIEPGAYSIEAQFDGTFARGNEETRILNTEFGLTPRLEAGVDLDFSEGAESRTLLNAKYLVSPADGRRPALAIGLHNAGSGVKSVPYAVTTADLGPARAHLGIARIEGSGRWFVGADKELTDRVAVMADYTSGDDNASSVGLSYQVSERFGVMAGALFPNAGGDTEFTLHFVFEGLCGRR